jgi:hypothetical protein
MIKEKKREVNTSTSHRGFQRRKDRTKKPKQKKDTKAVRTTVPVSHLFRDHQQKPV